MSVISLDPPIVGGKQKPPAVAGVGDENLEPKHKQMVRKLVNEAKDEQRPYLEVERSLQVKKDGKYHMNSFVSLHTFGLLLNPPEMPRPPFSVQQKGPEWRAVEYWSGSNHACLQCTDLSKVESYTDTTDYGYPVHVWVRGEDTLRIPPHERLWGEGLRYEPEQCLPRRLPLAWSCPC